MAELERRVINALRALGQAWDASEQYVVIGATALRAQLPSMWRDSHDVDIVIEASVGDVDRLGALLGKTWTRDAEKLQRWRCDSSDRVPIDLVPTGDGETITWPDGFCMSTLGLDLALTHRVGVRIEEGLVSPMAPPAMIAFLKIVTFYDNPQRRWDVRDLAHLLDGYLDEDDMRRWDSVELAEVEYDYQSAYALGFDLGGILPRTHHAPVETFCGRPPLSAMTVHGGPTGFSDERLLRRCIAVFLEGFRTATREDSR